LRSAGARQQDYQECENPLFIVLRGARSDWKSRKGMFETGVEMHTMNVFCSHVNELRRKWPVRAGLRWAWMGMGRETARRGRPKRGLSLREADAPKQSPARLLRYARNDSFPCHCEERSDEAIPAVHEIGSLRSQ
jgi:hypothetical protein